MRSTEVYAGIVLYEHHSTGYWLPECSCTYSIWSRRKSKEQGSSGTTISDGWSRETRHARSESTSRGIVSNKPPDGKSAKSQSGTLVAYQMQSERVDRSERSRNNRAVPSFEALEGRSVVLPPT